MKILIAFLLLASAASAQEDERVKRIVDRISREIRESNDRTREEIRAMLRAELEKGGAKPAPDPGPGPARRVTLGISVGDLSDSDRRTLGIEDGVKVAEVRGPAEAAGIVVGDVLIAIDGEPLTEASLGKALASKKPGDAVELTLQRGPKKRMKVSVVLAERKD
jgi:S1-C subfamily serine protease